MSEFLNTRLGTIHRGEILDLVDELESVCQVSSADFVNSPLIHFLTQCVYPMGASQKRKPISTGSVAIAPLLESKVGKLPDGDLHDFCTELALRNNTALEWYSGNKLAVFLNKTLPEFALPKRPTAKRSRVDAVAMQRRSNRG
jgi:hypothetical protein